MAALIVGTPPSPYTHTFADDSNRQRVCSVDDAEISARLGSFGRNTCYDGDTAASCLQ